VPLWLWGLDAFALIVLLAASLMALLVARRRMVGGRRGTFDLSVNRQAVPPEGPNASGWVLGVGSYRGDTLSWFRTFSFAWWPRYRIHRRELEILERRDPSGTEIFALDDGDVIIEVRHRSGVRQMAMSASALTGLLAWLESSPPGRDVNNVV
jgi:hypothetical protein